MASPTPPYLDNGKASITVALEDGQIKVTHVDGSILLEGPLPVGGWDRIVDAILHAAPRAHGAMRWAKNAR